MTVISSLCVYCGSSTGIDDSHRAAAARLGTLMAARGTRLIFGGGRVGLMGVVADAVIAGGGQVTGIIPEHIEESEVGHQGVDELIVVDNMHQRKHRMFRMADAFVVLPGGLGTLDETFEIITWRQLGLHDKPVVIVDNQGYWRPFIGLIDHVIDQGFARPAARRLFEVVTAVDDIFGLLDATAPPVRAAQDELI